MIRRSAAVILLALIGCGFYYWSYVKNDFNSSVIALIDQLTLQVDNGQKEQAKDTVEQIKEKYSGSENVFSAFANHEFLNQFSDHVSEIESAMKTDDPSRLDVAIITLKNHVSDFYKDNKVSLSSIL